MQQKDTYATRSPTFNKKSHRAANVSRNVIIDFEKGRRVPGRNNLAAIQRVLEEAGVKFTNGNAPGVRLKKSKK